MTSRRQFLQIGITAAACPLVDWPLAARAAHATSLDSSFYSRLMGVVYDTRFAESVAFAEHSAARGLMTHAIAGDMTHLWYDVVYHRWKQGPTAKQGGTALAGLTAHGPLFCFGELARDVGMRVVYREEHPPERPETGTTLYTWVIAPPRRA